MFGCYLAPHHQKGDPLQDSYHLGTFWIYSLAALALTQFHPLQGWFLPLLIPGPAHPRCLWSPDGQNSQASILAKSSNSLKAGWRCRSRLKCLTQINKASNILPHTGFRDTCLNRNDTTLQDCKTNESPFPKREMFMVMKSNCSIFHKRKPLRSYI